MLLDQKNLFHVVVGLDHDIDLLLLCILFGYLILLLLGSGIVKLFFGPLVSELIHVVFASLHHIYLIHNIVVSVFSVVCEMRMDSWGRFRGGHRLVLLRASFPQERETTGLKHGVTVEVSLSFPYLDVFNGDVIPPELQKVFWVLSWDAKLLLMLI
jgi:hypothetical protein